MQLLQERIYTIQDIYDLPDGQRAELIDGVFYMMAPPSTKHQEISGNLYYKIRNYIDGKKGKCKIYTAPFAVFLHDDDLNYVEPDISVICDNNKIDDKGCHGAPDWIIEIISPSTQHTDYGIKLFKYRTAGVKEYWIVNPLTHTANIYDFEGEKGTCQYSFDDDIPVCIFEDLKICISGLL